MAYKRYLQTYADGYDLIEGVNSQASAVAVDATLSGYISAINII